MHKSLGLTSPVTPAHTGYTKTRNKRCVIIIIVIMAAPVVAEWLPHSVTIKFDDPNHCNSRAKTRSFWPRTEIELWIGGSCWAQSLAVGSRFVILFVCTCHWTGHEYISRRPCSDPCGQRRERKRRENSDYYDDNKSPFPGRSVMRNVRLLDVARPRFA